MRRIHFLLFFFFLIVFFFPFPSIPFITLFRKCVRPPSQLLSSRLRDQAQTLEPALCVASPSRFQCGSSHIWACHPPCPRRPKEASAHSQKQPQYFISEPWAEQSLCFHSIFRMNSELLMHLLDKCPTWETGIG